MANMKTPKSKKNLTELQIDEIVARQASDEAAWEEPIHVPAKPWAKRVRVRRLDLAAKFHVLSVLYRLGAEAAVSVGRDRDVDIMVVNKPGEVLTVDVKVASATNTWTASDFPPTAHHFVVFVFFSRNEALGQEIPESYVLSSRDLRAWAHRQGVISVDQLASSAKDAREAWERLLPAA
jgi:hypothetical protein